MTRLSSILRRFARTYLVAVGGGFALISLIGIFENVKLGFHKPDKSDVEYLRGAGSVLAISILAVIAGIGIHKYLWWALPLTVGMSLMIVGYNVPGLISDPLEPGTFTIVIPMLAILAWASLPATWLEFKQQGAKTS